MKAFNSFRHIHIYFGKDSASIINLQDGDYGVISSKLEITMIKRSIAVTI